MEKTMGTGEAARLLGTTGKPLQRWEREGRIVPAAGTVINRRRYVHCFSSRLRRLLPCHRQPRATPESDHAACAPDQD
jgi:DNA-binding transcriptional MerR regulator